MVLLHLGIPGIDGFEVARQVRAEPEYPNEVLIALTGWGQEEDRRRLEESGLTTTW